MYIAQKFQDAKVMENGLIYFDNALQALCRYDINEKRVCIMAEYNGSPASARKIFDLGDVIFIIMTNADLLKYNKKCKSFQTFSCDIPENLRKGISQIFLHDNKIYMLARHFSVQPLICFDISEEIYASKYFLCDSIQSETEWFNFAYAYDSQFWAVNYGTPDYYCIDPITERFWTYSLKRSEKLHSICKCDERLLAATVDSKVISIGEDGNYETLWIGTDKEAYSYMVEIKDYIAVLPRYGNHMLLCDKNTYSCQRILINWNEARDSGGKSARCVSCCENDKTIFVFPNRVSRVFAVDKQSLKSSVLNPKFDTNVEARYYQQQWINKFRTESDVFKLDDFCQIVSMFTQSG